MGDRTGIEWTDATVNFWWGCTKVGPGCDHCYAETWASRFGGGLWGVGAPRRKIKSAVKLLYRLHNDYSWWSADHHIGGMHAMGRRRVFIQSMSDLFDKEVPVEWFVEGWAAIKACDRLAIQIVTKRISYVEKRLAEIGETAWPQHAGLIISVVNQEEADRDVPRLVALKAKLNIPWVGLSIEPMLGPVDLSDLMFVEKECPNWEMEGSPPGMDPETGAQECCTSCDWTGIVSEPCIDWIIVGGESGRGARPMHRDWARSLRDQCAAAGVPFLFKQWGEWFPFGEIDANGHINRRARGGRPGLWHEWGDGEGFSCRIGKKQAGRLIDGVEHNGLPA